MRSPLRSAALGERSGKQRRSQALAADTKAATLVSSAARQVALPVTRRLT